MFDTQHAKENFSSLTHQEKIVKVKAILAHLKDKSIFFTKIYEYFKNKRNIEEVVLDYLYQVVMALVNNRQINELLVPEKDVLHTLKLRIKK